MWASGAAQAAQFVRSILRFAVSYRACAALDSAGKTRFVQPARARYAIDATPNYHTKYYTMNPKAAAMPASVGLKDSSSSSCVSKLTSVLPGRDLIA